MLGRPHCAGQDGRLVAITPTSAGPRATSPPTGSIREAAQQDPGAAAPWAYAARAARRVCLNVSPVTVDFFLLENFSCLPAPCLLRAHNLSFRLRAQPGPLDAELALLWQGEAAVSAAPRSPAGANCRFR